MIYLSIVEKNKIKKIHLTNDLYFNIVLYKHKELIAKIIESEFPRFPIDTNNFNIINRYIETDILGNIIYPGLIIRCKVNEYLVLSLEGSKINEEKLIEIITSNLKGNKKNRVIKISIIKIKKEKFLRNIKGLR